jgi:hypothetical protein
MAEVGELGVDAEMLLEGKAKSESPKPVDAQCTPTFEDGMAIRMEDGHSCLVKNNSATLVGKRSQTYEGMKEQGHDLAQHCCWGKGGCQGKCGSGN